jgi:hypothetical protein
MIFKNKHFTVFTSDAKIFFPSQGMTKSGFFDFEAGFVKVSLKHPGRREKICELWNDLFLWNVSPLHRGDYLILDLDGPEWFKYFIVSFVMRNLSSGTITSFNKTIVVKVDNKLCVVVYSGAAAKVGEKYPFALQD